MLVYIDRATTLFIWRSLLLSLSMAVRGKVQKKKQDYKHILSSPLQPSSCMYYRPLTSSAVKVGSVVQSIECTWKANWGGPPLHSRPRRCHVLHYLSRAHTSSNAYDNLCKHLVHYIPYLSTNSQLQFFCLQRFNCTLTRHYRACGCGNFHYQATAGLVWMARQLLCITY